MIDDTVSPPSPDNSVDSSSAVTERIRPQLTPNQMLERYLPGIPQFLIVTNEFTLLRNIADEISNTQPDPETGFQGAELLSGGTNGLLTTVAEDVKEIALTETKITPINEALSGRDRAQLLANNRENYQAIVHEILELKAGVDENGSSDLTGKSLLHGRIADRVKAGLNNLIKNDGTMEETRLTPPYDTTIDTITDQLVESAVRQELNEITDTIALLTNVSTILVPTTLLDKVAEIVHQRDSRHSEENPVQYIIRNKGQVLEILSVMRISLQQRTRASHEIPHEKLEQAGNAYEAYAAVRDAEVDQQKLEKDLIELTAYQNSLARRVVEKTPRVVALVRADLYRLARIRATEAESLILQDNLQGASSTNATLARANQRLEGGLKETVARANAANEMAERQANLREVERHLLTTATHTTTSLLEMAREGRTPMEELIVLIDEDYFSLARGSDKATITTLSSGIVNIQNSAGTVNVNGMTIESGVLQDLENGGLIEIGHGNRFLFVEDATRSNVLIPLPQDNYEIFNAMPLEHRRLITLAMFGTLEFGQQALLRERELSERLTTVSEQLEELRDREREAILQLEITQLESGLRELYLNNTPLLKQIGLTNIELNQLRVTAREEINRDLKRAPETIPTSDEYRSYVVDLYKEVLIRVLEAKSLNRIKDDIGSLNLGGASVDTSLFAELLTGVLERDPRYASQTVNIGGYNISISDLVGRLKEPYDPNKYKYAGLFGGIPVWVSRK